MSSPRRRSSWFGECRTTTSGFPGGNPAGTIASTNQLFYGPTTLNGQTVAISYQISYVDDHGAKTQTYADYKRVVVTITGNGNVLATKTTNVAALTGAAGGGSEYVTIRRLVVDMAAGNPPLANVPVSIANGPSAPRSDTTNAAGSVIFPQLTVNPNTSSFYDVTASAAGYSTYPGDLPYAGTGSPAISLEQVNHLTGNDDLQTIHLYANGIATKVNVYKSDGVTPFPASTTVYMGAGLAGNTGTAAVGSPTSATISQLQLGNSYLSPAVSTISIFPGNYTFSAQSGTAGSMTYAAPAGERGRPEQLPARSLEDRQPGHVCEPGHRQQHGDRDRKTQWGNGAGRARRALEHGDRSHESPERLRLGRHEFERPGVADRPAGKRLHDPGDRRARLDRRQRSRTRRSRASTASATLTITP